MGHSRITHSGDIGLNISSAEPTALTQSCRDAKKIEFGTKLTRMRAEQKIPLKSLRLRAFALSFSANL
jgi:hypothetical protein